MMVKRYGYMGGMPGCMPDYHSGFCFETEQEAIDACVDMYDLDDTEIKKLCEFCLFYVHGERYHEIGAGVLEIVSDMVDDEAEDKYYF